MAGKKLRCRKELKKTHPQVLRGVSIILKELL